MNLSLPGALRGAAVAGLVFCWMVAAHWGSDTLGNPNLRLALAVSPLIVAGAMIFVTHAGRWWAWALAVLLAGGLWTLWPVLRINVPLVYYLQHLGTHLALAVMFGRTLMGPGDALITRMSRFILGEHLSERNIRYTRKLTGVWTLFFLVNALASTVLFVWAPVQWWSVYANLLTGPLIGSIFLIEHLVRRRLLPPHERPSFKAIVLAYQQRRHLGLGKTAPRS